MWCDGRSGNQRAVTQVTGCACAAHAAQLPQTPNVWSKKGTANLEFVLTRLDHANTHGICKTMCVIFCKLGALDSSQKEGVILKTLKSHIPLKTTTCHPLQLRIAELTPGIYKVFLLAVQAGWCCWEPSATSHQPGETKLELWRGQTREGRIPPPHSPDQLHENNWKQAGISHITYYIKRIQLEQRGQLGEHYPRCRATAKRHCSLRTTYHGRSCRVHTIPTTLQKGMNA